ncbi:MAG: LuxR C-terminal-related transcriptional regulator, partial [Dehalococcoidia bacterium]
SQSLVLVLDDLQWADESSLLLLEFLAREITSRSLMVVATYRDMEVSGRHPLVQTLGNLVREPHFLRVQMGGLTRKEVGQFVEARAGVSVADIAVDTLYQRTEGNPLFVSEVVGSVDPEEMGRDQEWIANIPEAVREAISRRLIQLSEPCYQLLRTASVIGRDFDLPLLRALSQEIEEEEFLESLEEALNIRIVESLPTGTGGYRFNHALIQQTVYEEISPIRKAQAHAAVGAALEELHSRNLDEHAGELARHFAEAGAVSGTEKMVRYSLIAGGRALETFGYEQALINFGRVLAAKEGQEPDAESAAAFFGLARAQTATLPRHELREAHLNLIRAFDYYESVGDTANLVAIAELPLLPLTEHGVPTGMLVTRALELVPNDSIEAARLHSFHGNVQGLTDGDYQSARDSFDRALAIARREGDAALEMRTLNFAAQVELWHHRFEESLKSSLTAIDLAVTASDFRGEVSARYWASLASRILGDMQESQLQGLAILAPAERLRDRYWLATAHNAIAWSHTLRGDWQSARETNLRGLDWMPFDPRLLLQHVILEAESGNQSESESKLEQLEDVVRNSEAGPTTANACLAFGSPLVESIHGDSKRSSLAESSIAAVLLSSSATPFFSTWARVGASLLAVANDDAEAATEQYFALKPMAGIMVLSVNADRVLGLLAGTMGQLGIAVGHFEAAALFCRKTGHHPALAWTCHDHAAALLKLGGPSGRQKAAPFLEEGQSIATELGMLPLVERFSALREQLTSQPARTPAYPDGLTQREIDVLQLICGGKTDREIGEELFISVRTVGHHVSNILNKTNTANRTEAATYAALNGISAIPPTE